MPTSSGIYFSYYWLLIDNSNEVLLIIRNYTNVIYLPVIVLKHYDCHMSYVYVSSIQVINVNYGTQCM